MARASLLSSLALTSDAGARSAERPQLGITSVGEVLLSENASSRWGTAQTAGRYVYML